MTPSVYPPPSFPAEGFLFPAKRPRRAALRAVPALRAAPAAAAAAPAGPGSLRSPASSPTIPLSPPFPSPHPAAEPPGSCTSPCIQSSKKSQPRARTARPCATRPHAHDTKFPPQIPACISQKFSPVCTADFTPRSLTARWKKTTIEDGRLGEYAQSICKERRGRHEKTVRCAGAGRRPAGAFRL